MKTLISYNEATRLMEATVEGVTVVTVRGCLWLEADQALNALLVEIKAARAVLAAMVAEALDTASKPAKQPKKAKAKAKRRRPACGCPVCLPLPVEPDGVYTCFADKPICFHVYTEGEYAGAFGDRLAADETYRRLRYAALVAA